MKIIVDIDNTLWHFSPVLYKRMRDVSPTVTPPSEWHEFDFWKAYISPKKFYSILKGIHIDQEQFNPYPDAETFLSSLKENGYHIIIASHREKGTFDVTAKWLQKNNLVYDELHLSNDKTVLFHDCRAIVDDSPFTLEKARRAGIICTGLKMPWNEHKGYTLFQNLTEVLQFLKEQ